MPHICHFFNWFRRNSFQNNVCSAFFLQNAGFNNSEFNGKVPIPVAAYKACGAVKPLDIDARLATTKLDLKGKYDIDACYGFKRRRGFAGVIMAARIKQKDTIIEDYYAATLSYWFLPLT